MATHSSVLAWRIPETEEPGRKPSMGSHRVGHDWSDLACMHACMSNISYLFQVSQQPYRWNLLCSLWGWGTTGILGDISDSQSPSQGEAEPATRSFWLDLRSIFIALYQVAFLWADLRFECRGQDANNCWVRISLLFENKTFSLTKNIQVPKVSAPDGMLPWKCPHNGQHYERHFSNQLCFGVFRAIKRPVRNHKTSMFLTLLKLKKG